MNLSIKAFGLKKYLESSNISQFNLDDIVPIFKDGISSVTSAVHELEKNDIIYKALDPNKKNPANRYFVKSNNAKLTESLLLELGFKREIRGWERDIVLFTSKENFNLTLIENGKFEFNTYVGLKRNIESLEHLKILFHTLTGQNL